MKFTKLKYNSYTTVFLWILLLLGIFVTKYLTQEVDFVENTYPTIYQWIFNNYSGVFNFLPFSLGDVLYFFLFLFLFLSVIKMVNNIRRKAFSSFFKILNLILMSLGFLWLAFHWLWGFNYYKSPLIDNNVQQKMPVEDLKEMALYHFHRAEKLSMKSLIFDEDKEVKVSLFSPLMRYFGVTGYFNPFTTEAQRVGEVPEVRIPFTNAHEKAHQKSWAREYEANYIGYHAALKGNVASQYSAEYIALNYVLGALYQQDSVFVKGVVKRYSPRMKLDREQIIAYHEKYKGWADRMFSQMNHYFLKSNNQQEGIKSYSRFVELLHQDYLKRKKE